MWRQPSRIATAASVHALFFRLQPKFSSMNASAGVAIDTDEVMPAKKRRPNHITPAIAATTGPPGRLLKTSGIEMKPRSNEPPFATATAPATPKNVTTAGIASDPPSTTSAVSFVAAVAIPERVRSSFLVRYDAYACSEPMPTAERAPRPVIPCPFPQARPNPLVGLPHSRLQSWLCL